MSSVSKLAQQTEFTLIHPQGGTTPVLTSLSWTADAPLQIDMAFQAGKQRVFWIAGRDLLREGVTYGSAGDGDIHISPEPLDDDYLRLTLNSPSGRACFRAPIVDLAQFLDDVFEAVPDADVPLVNDLDIEELIDSCS